MGRFCGLPWPAGLVFSGGLAVDSATSAEPPGERGGHFDAMIGLANVYQWLLAAAVFVLLLILLVLGSSVRAFYRWRQLRRMGALLSFNTYMALRWQGVDVVAVAAAYATAHSLGQPVPVDDWVSFAVLGVDVVNLAAALGAASKGGLEVNFGQLGAAALAGYDPIAVVQEAQRRGLKCFGATELAQVPDWQLTRRDRPA